MGESPVSLSVAAIGSGPRAALTQPIGRFAERISRRFDAPCPGAENLQAGVIGMDNTPIIASEWREACTSEETAMGAIGAVFQPELIELMKAVLDDAAAMLPEAERTSTMKAEIASHIVACAAKGERNPTALKIAALPAVVECSHYSHYISPERRAV
jgi:hypothetical protein